MTPRRRRVALVATAAVLAAGVVAGGWLAFGRSATASAGGAPTFVEETATAGVNHTYDGGLAEAVGGGVAVFDCNGDGRPDLFLAGGTNPAALYRNDTTRGGGLRFTALPSPVTDLVEVNGAYPIDIDGDRQVDLVVLRNGEGNVLLRGLGDCRFRDGTSEWGLDPGRAHTEAFSAMWEPGASLPTLAFGNYVDPAVKDPASWCEPNALVRPTGDRYAKPIALTPSWCTLSLLFSDWDGSGRMDLRVSNDRDYYPQELGSEQLWRVAPGEAPRLYTAADGWATVRVQGMGIGSYDVTGDGLPEVYLTSEDDSKLQTLASGASKPTYEDIGLKYGVNVTQPFTGPDVHLPSTAWHPEFEDVNNDGFIDLLVTKGNVKGQLDHAMEDPTNLLLGQPDGTFREAAEQAGILNFDKARGAALADFDLDGRLDLVLANYGAPVRIWQNAPELCVPEGCSGRGGDWLALRLAESGPNVDAIGAVVEVQAGGVTSRRELTIGGGHAGGQLGWIHFGLGSAGEAQVRVRWPDGTTGPWTNVRANTFVTIDREAGVEAWTPPA